MGRIKSIAIKNLGKEFIKGHGKDFSTDFDGNKEALGKIRKIRSKKNRNVVAGYITKEMKKRKRMGNV